MVHSMCDNQVCCTAFLSAASSCLFKLGLGHVVIHDEIVETPGLKSSQKIAIGSEVAEVPIKLGLKCLHKIVLILNAKMSSVL